MAPGGTGVWLDVAVICSLCVVKEAEAVSFPQSHSACPRSSCLKYAASGALGSLPETYIRVSPRHCQLAAWGSMPGWQALASRPLPSPGTGAPEVSTQPPRLRKGLPFGASKG